MITELILATRNDHKLREFTRLLPDVRLLPLPADAPTPAETGSTFAENALIKARSAYAATGRPALADDSGIGAAVLDWAPGVWSARFAGPDATDADNRALLSERVAAGTPLRYTCVLALVLGPGEEELFEGICDGTMAPAASGRGGFGYDPLFVVPGGRTMAELSDAEKDAGSHRGSAARLLIERLSAG